MKNFIKIFALMLVLVISVCAFSSCDEANDGDDGDNAVISGNDAIDIMNPERADDGLPVFPVYEIKNLSEYKLIRSDICSDKVKTEFSALWELLCEVSGDELALSTDYDAPKQYEILIGDTDRKESKDIELTEKQYIIKMVGDKIVIKGGSDEALTEAIEQFKYYFVRSDKLYVPSKGGVYYTPVYIFDNIKIDGKDISEYKIYAVKAECARRLSENIENRLSGQKVATVTEMKEGEGPYIILDASSPDYRPYKAEVKDGNLTVTGSFKSCIEFLSHYENGGQKEVNITGTIEGNIAAPVLYNKEQLMTVMKKVYDSDNVIIGQAVNSGDERPSKTIDLFYEGAGENPGILAYDLACYGINLPTAIPEDKSQVFCEFVEYAENGGIVSLHSHYANPTGNWGDQAMVRGQLGGEEAWKELLTPGTELYNTFMEEVRIDGEFLKLFNDIGLPIVWRPLHEMNSNWFWYGIAESGKTLDADYIVRLWRLIYDTYKEMGLDNLIWNYSPNNDTGWIDVMYCYPGDEYVDMVGLDWYTSGGYEINSNKRSYATLMGKDMITNVCEFGINPPLEADNRQNQPKTFNSMDFTALVKQMMNDGYKLGYILTWTAADTVLWWGKGEEMMATGIFLGQDDLLPMFQAEGLGK